MTIHTSVSGQKKALDLLKKEVREMQEITLVALEEAEKSLDLIIANSDDYFTHPNKYAMQIEIPKTISFAAPKVPLASNIRKIQ